MKPTSLPRTARALSCGAFLAAAALALAGLVLPGEASAQIRLKQTQQWRPTSTVPSQSYNIRDTQRYRDQQRVNQEFAERRRKVEAEQRRFASEFMKPSPPSRRSSTRCCTGAVR